METEAQDIRIIYPEHQYVEFRMYGVKNRSEAMQRAAEQIRKLLGWDPWQAVDLGGYVMDFEPEVFQQGSISTWAVNVKGRLPA